MVFLKFKLESPEHILRPRGRNWKRAGDAIMKDNS